MGRLSRFFLAIILVESPLLLGSNRAIFWAINGILASAALFFFVIAEWKSIKRSTSDWALQSYLLILLLLPAIWMLVQLIPNMPDFLAHPVWHFVPEGWRSISISPEKTALALVWWLTMGIAFVAVRAGTRRGGARFFLQLMLAVSTVVALFGLCNKFFGWQSFGLVQKFTTGAGLSGTFVNPNTAASFFVFGAAIATILIIDSYKDLQKKFFGASPAAQFFLMVSSSISIPVAAGIIIFVAALLTLSRGGLASLVLAISMVLILIPKKANKLSWRYASIAFLVLILVSVSANALLERRNSASSSWARLELAHEAISAIADRPLLGNGAGTYQDVEPLYHSPENTSRLVWVHAHNTYLEAASDIGVPITAIWLSVLVFLLLNLRKAQNSASKLALATIVLLAVSISEGLHALVDFGLQTQSIAIYVSCLLGLAVGEAISKEGSVELGSKKQKAR